MQRFKVLDAFRGLAILAVMLYHYTTTYRIHDSSFDPVLNLRQGYLGVHFFFIISGFVIFLTLNHSSSAWEFLYKRFSRLYPTFWFCLCLSYCFYQYVPPVFTEELSIQDFIINFSMIPGFFQTPRADGAYWSLVPEVFFYMAMAFLFFFRRYKPWLFWGIAVIILTWLNTFLFHLDGRSLHFGNMLWGPLFFAGILFFMMREKQNNLLFHLLVIITIPSTCINLKSVESWIIITVIYSLFYLFVFGKLQWLTWKPLVFLGRISFPLYLIHQNIGYFILNETASLIPNANLRLVLVCCMMIVAAFIIHKAIELPSIRMLRRLIQKPAETNSAAAA